MKDSMKRLILRSLVAGAAFAPLALSSCGGDDDKGNSNGDGDGDGDASTGGVSGDGDGDGDTGTGGFAGDGDGDTASGGTGGSTGGSMQGGAGPGGEGGMGGGPSTTVSCDNPPAPSPNVIAETQLATTYPTPMGGTIANGLYYLSEMNIYSPATADENTRARAFLIEDGALIHVKVDNGGPQAVLAGTFTVSGTSLTIEQHCPGVGAGAVSYTATANELWLFDEDEPSIQIYTLQ